MLKYVYVHNAFMMLSTLMLHTPDKIVYYVHTIHLYITPGFDFGAWANHKVHTERAEKSSTGEAIIIVPQAQSL